MPTASGREVNGFFMLELFQPQVALQNQTHFGGETLKPGDHDDIQLETFVWLSHTLCFLVKNSGQTDCIRQYQPWERQQS